MTTPINASPSTPLDTTAKSGATTKDPLTDKNTFLQLLVAQLKHQDPLNPADGLQFVTQLAQFTSLEQSMEIRSELRAIREALTANPHPNSPT